MRATVLHGVRDIRVDVVEDPRLLVDSDAVVRAVASCVCGSDLWPYRGENPFNGPTRAGHELVGVVEQVGSAVSTVREGDFVIVPFVYADNTCAVCQRGVQTSCPRGGYWGSPDSDGHVVDGLQGELVRIPFADGTLVKTPTMPDASLIPHLLTLADVFPTGHHAAMSAGVTAGSTVVVVGDGAVGLCAVLAAKRLGADRVIAMSRHADRQELALRFGADHIVAERGDEGAAAVREIFDGIGADCVLECVGTNESMKQALRSARPGGNIGYVGLPHGVQLDVRTMFGGNLGLKGGLAPVRAYLPDLLQDVLDGVITPGDVFDLTLPLDAVAEGYRAMDERRAIKTMLTF